ncbi:nuclease-related domain-containing protein [Ammoniphilus sp. 3BR4]|uniref:nuclease-related domain-containing protein n=1 Tax=Ammoniphilus sp. 3BR4 TaxID=3158265 RepID=UPI00346628EA
MLKKQREFPLRIKLEEALLRRLPLHHKKREEILVSLRKLRAGYRGEQELDYHLQFLPEKEYLIFQDLRLPIDDQFVQLDTLILSPWFALIIESKNIYGHLYFDPVSKQVIRTYNNTKEGFPDPILQVKRQRTQLQKWMEIHMSKSIPIHCLVAIGYPSTIVETTPGNRHIFQIVHHAEHIPNKVLDLAKTAPSPSLTTYQLRKISQLLINQHTSQDFDVLDWYQIHPTEFIRGIPCFSCNLETMQRIHGNWLCKTCKLKRKKAHVQVIQDHILLHGTITNEQCRKLLGLSSIHTSTRLLLSMNLPFQGSTKDRVYTK